MAAYLVETGHAALNRANRYRQIPLDLCSSKEMQLRLHGQSVVLVRLNEMCATDLAKKQGQDPTIVPFEEHPRSAGVNIIGASSAQSVVDIRELQFEHSRYSNHRKEVRRDTRPMDAHLRSF